MRKSIGKRHIKAEMKGEIMELKIVLNKIIRLENPTKKLKSSHNKPILYGMINSTLGKSEIHSFRITLDSRASSSIVLGKHTKKHVIRIPSRLHGTPKAVTPVQHIPSV